MLDSSCFVQTNTGSTGSGGPVTTMTATLSSPTTSGNAVLFIGCGSAQSVTPTDSTFNGIASTASGPNVQVRARNTSGGETSFPLSVSAPSDIGWWWIGEISGLASMSTYVDPSFNTHVIGVEYETASAHQGCSTVGASFTSATCDTLNSPPAPLTSNGDDLIVVVGAALVNSGAVPSLTSCTDVGGGQPGTLTQLGTSFGTTRASGTNISSSIFYRLSDGTNGISFVSRFTWAFAPASATAVSAVMKAEWAAPLQTLGRGATNSMI